MPPSRLVIRCLLNNYFLRHCWRGFSFHHCVCLSVPLFVTRTTHSGVFSIVRRCCVALRLFGKRTPCRLKMPGSRAVGAASAVETAHGVERRAVGGPHSA